jgi:hypothetical protein
VVIDGVKGKEYDGINVESLTFSPDGQRLAYRAKRLEKEAKGLGLFELEKAVKKLVVVDGKEFNGYDGSITDDLVFSPDSKHLAFQAFILGEEFVVLDGKKAISYRAASTPVFGPDGEHFAYVASRGASFCVIVFDGKESREYEEAPWYSIKFIGPTSLTAQVRTGGKQTMVRLELCGDQLVESITAATGATVRHQEIPDKSSGQPERTGVSHTAEQSSTLLINPKRLTQGGTPICPKCKQVRGLGTSRCWSKDCGDSTPLSDCPQIPDPTIEPTSILRMLFGKKSRSDNS